MPEFDPQSILDAQGFDPEKIRTFAEAARQQGFNREQVKAFIVQRPEDFKWKPRPMPESTLRHLPKAYGGELWGGAKRDIELLGRGIKESESGFFYPVLANLAGLGEKGSAALSPHMGLPEGEESAFETIFRKARELAERGGELTTPAPEQRDLNTMEKVVKGVGAAPVTIGTYGAATLAAGGNPVAGMAAVDALREADKGLWPAIKGGIRGATLGRILHAAAPLAPLARTGTMAGIFGGQAALEGGDASDVTAGAILGAGLANLGPRGQVKAGDVAGEIRLLTQPRKAAAAREIGESAKVFGKPAVKPKATILELKKTPRTSVLEKEAVFRIAPEILASDKPLPKTVQDIFFPQKKAEAEPIPNIQEVAKQIRQEAKMMEPQNEVARFFEDKQFDRPYRESPLTAVQGETGAVRLPGQEAQKTYDLREKIKKRDVLPTSEYIM
ncbi:MAG: hypothetical protein ACYTEQ_28465, partial [Planctomycetota bacterium]